MSQVTDWDVDNAGGSAVRSQMNGILAALRTASSGPTAPSPTAAGMAWFDTTTLTMKMRNNANSAWVTVTPETIAANSLWGNPTGSTGALQAISMATLQTMLGFGQSHASAGYQILPGGLILQWASVFSGAAGSTVTFPMTFPASCWGVYGNHEGSTDVNVTVAAITTSGFFIRAFNQPGSLLNALCKYFAIGK